MLKMYRPKHYNYSYSRTTTILCYSMEYPIKVIKRFYPKPDTIKALTIAKNLTDAGSIIPKTTYLRPDTNIVTSARQIPIKPLITTVTDNKAIVKYDPAMADFIIKSKTFERNNILNLLKKLEKEEPNKNELNLETQPLLNNLYAIQSYRICAEPLRYLNLAINTKPLLDANIKQILKNLSNTTNLQDDEQQELILTLRNYFVKYPPTVDNAQTFLSILEKSNVEFKPLALKNNTEKDIVVQESQETTHVIKTKVTDKTISFSEKQQQFLQELNKVVDYMENLFKKYEKNPQEIFKDKDVDLWHNFVLNRGKILPMTPEEHVINNKFKQLYEQYVPKESDLFKQKKDIFKLFKEESTLPEILKTFDEEPCILPGDYELLIKKTQQALAILVDDKMLSTTDLKIIALNSSAAVLDDEGTFKLTQEAYKSFTPNASSLNFEYLNHYPQIDLILDKIKRKDFFIAHERKSMDENFVIQPAHLSHKTLVVFDECLGKNILVQIGMLTSTKDDTTFKIDDRQQTNPDFQKQFKSQMFRVLGTFMVVDTDDQLTIDMEATLFFKSKNSNNEIISELLYNAYSARKDVWSNNPYQLSYNADNEFLSNISKIFLEQKLRILEEKLLELKLLAKSSPEKYFEHISNLNIEKEKLLQEKNNQRYFSLLPEEFRKFIITFKIFEERQVIEEKKRVENNNKIKDAQTFSAFKKVKEDETKFNNEKTAKEKKEEYLKAKKQAVVNVKETAPINNLENETNS